MRILLVLLSACMFCFAGCDDSVGGNGGYNVTFNASSLGATNVVYDKGFTTGGGVPVVMYNSSPATKATSATSTLIASAENMDFTAFLTASSTGTYTSFDNFIYLIMYSDEVGENVSVNTTSSVVKISGTEYGVTGGTVDITAFGVTGQPVEGEISITIGDGNHGLSGTFKAMSLDLSAGK